MAENNLENTPNTPVEYKAGEIQTGKVTGITSFGAFVKLTDGTEGLVHISEIANTYVTNIENFIKLGDEVSVKVLGKNNKGKYDLSIKQAKVTTAAPVYNNGLFSGDKKKEKVFEPGSFDEMMHSFMKRSEEHQLDVRRNLQYKQGVKKKGQKKKKIEE